MDFQGIKPDLVRYQMRMVQGETPAEKEQKRPGAFGRFLSGAGRVLGAAALPLSILFPPAAIAAAGLYGVGQIGDQSQARSYAKQMENAQRTRNVSISYPGMDMDSGSLRPASFDVMTQDQDIANVLFTRDQALSEMNQSLVIK